MISILIWHKKEMWHCCNVFQRTILQRTPTEVNIYMPRHQMRSSQSFSCTTLATWFITNFHMLTFSIGSTGNRQCHVRLSDIFQPVVAPSLAGRNIWVHSSLQTINFFQTSWTWSLVFRWLCSITTSFDGDWSGNHFYGHSLPTFDSRRASYWWKDIH